MWTCLKETEEIFVSDDTWKAAKVWAEYIEATSIRRALEPYIRCMKTSEYKFTNVDLDKNPFKTRERHIGEERKLFLSFPFCYRPTEEERK